jgi:uncharacterized membrane-anchored protein
MTSAPVDRATRSGSVGRDTRARRLRVLGAVAASCALVVVAVWQPLAARLTGEEIALRVEPIDPLDPFRGAYVELGYPDLPLQPLQDSGPVSEEEAEAFDEARGTAYVPLRQQGAVWVGGSVQRTRPSDGMYLTCDDSEWRLSCGIESWFLPQDEARALEEVVRGGTAVATVKVDGGGNAALVAVEAR